MHDSRAYRPKRFLTRPTSSHLNLIGALWSPKARVTLLSKQRRQNRDANLPSHQLSFKPLPAVGEEGGLKYGFTIPDRVIQLYPFCCVTKVTEC